MQATQRKTEYRPSSAASGKRIVKKNGNVAYIKTGSPKSTALRGDRIGSPKSTALRGEKTGSQRNAAYGGRKTAAPRGTLGVKHPVRVGGGQSARTAGNRVVHGGAASKSSVIVNINKQAAKQGVRKAPAAQKAKHMHAGVLSTIFVIFAAFCAMSLLISRYAAISAVGTENNKLKSSINDVQVKIEQLKVDMELQDNVENVRNTALNVLGMTYPDESQKVYLDMS